MGRAIQDENVHDGTVHHCAGALMATQLAIYLQHAFG